ncbi:MAG: hypothetical protein SYC29_13560 [Planctomycetota bacterium]|nr:hypothetical protein [Planctomycetota bacterium]
MPGLGALGLAAVAAIGASVAGPAAGFHLFPLNTTLGPETTAYEDGWFGYATAIGGEFIIVGVEGAAPTGVDDLGMCRIYHSDGTTWLSDTCDIYDESLGEAARFGWAVDIDATGEVPRVIVGAPLADDIGAAEVWWYNEAADEWLLEATFVPPADDADCQFPYYGWSVAMHGDTALVGAPGVDVGVADDNAGAVYVYQFDGATWDTEPAAAFYGTVGDPDDVRTLGSHLDIEGDFFIASGPNTYYGGLTHAGAAFVYDRSVDGTWSLRQELSDPAPETYGRYGSDVAILGSLIVIGDIGGSPGAGDGAVHVYFDEDGDKYWEPTECETVSPCECGVQHGDDFGSAVAVDESYIIVGAPKRDVDGLVDAGAICILENTAPYDALRQIKESSPAEENGFGKAVAVSDGRIVVGAPKHDRDGLADSGIAYVYGSVEFGVLDWDILHPIGPARLRDWSLSWAVGSAPDEGVSRAVAWEQQDDGTWLDTFLPDLGHGSRANSLCDNENGGPPIGTGVAGTVLEEQGVPRAAVWERDGSTWQLTLLEEPPDTTESKALCSTLFELDDPDATRVSVVGGSALIQGPRAVHGFAIVYIKRFDPLYKLSLLPGPGESDMGRVEGVAGWVAGKSSEIMAVGSAAVDDGAFRRPVRWREAGDTFEAFFLPMLPDGGPAGSATEIMRYDDGSVIILGQAEASDGSLVPVQWKSANGASWGAPQALSTELEPPLNNLSPLGAPGCTFHNPVYGPIVGIGTDADGYTRGVLWEPEYAGGQLHDLTGFLGDLPGDQIVFDAVAMRPDGRIGANFASADDPDGPTTPVILIPIGEEEPDPCPWDFDGDGEVGSSDLLHLLGCWGQSCGDVDGDGDTDSGDLLALLGAWGECP